MTDKEQIIINGIDVNKCEYFKDGMCYAECDLEGYTDWECKDAELSNCYFKQLARKMQECESLKEEIKILQDNFDTATRDCNDRIDDLKDECKELKNEVKQLKDAIKREKEAGYSIIERLL